MKALSKLIFNEVFRDYDGTYCATNKALYFEKIIDGQFRYFKLVPEECTGDEMHDAWDTTFKEGES